VSFSTGDDLDYLKGLAKERQRMMGEQLYVQPRVENGRLQTGYLMSENDVVVGIQPPSNSVPVVGSGRAVKITSEDVVTAEVCAELMAIDINDNKDDDAKYGDYGDMEEVKSDECLGIRGEEASVSVEEVGETLGGCAGQEDEIVIEGIKGTRSVLVEEIRKDDSLRVARGLAEKNQEGYRFEDGVILRTRLDTQGDSKTQICLPKAMRSECMRLAHTKFGHMGRNKMCQLITPYFYWPNLSKDCQVHIRNCDVCQRHDKTRPPVSPMQTREIVTIPFKRVAVDLVGPFPSAKGGFRFLLTCVDLATRWPEVVPIRTCTARIIIDKIG